ncbi:hypothetical protein [uncultured Microscilla sp.]|nr:hypothetical protein [uncultured Microscilla sp.]
MKFLNEEFQKPTFPNFDIVYHAQMPGGEGSTSDDDADAEDKPTGDRD